MLLEKLSNCEFLATTIKKNRSETIMSIQIPLIPCCVKCFATFSTFSFWYECFAGLEHCALTLDYHFDPRRPKYSILLWGDTNGSVVVMRFYDYLKICLFGYSKGGGTTMQSLLSGDFANLVVAKFQNVHSGWVQTVRYFISPKVCQILCVWLTFNRFKTNWGHVVQNFECKCCTWVLNHAVYHKL